MVAAPAVEPPPSRSPSRVPHPATSSSTLSSSAPTATLAILGGTGDLGRGLALRWAAAGCRVVIGSRAPARAQQVAVEIATQLVDVPGARAPEGADNRAAALVADVVVLSVPYDALSTTAAAVAEEVAGKVLLSAVVPLRPPRVSTAWQPPAGSAAAELQALLPAARVVVAFQNVAAGKLARLGTDVGCDVLVCGDEPEAKGVVLALAEAIGVTAFDAGPLANAGVVEGLTAVLIGLNRRLKVAHAGIRLSNVPRP